MAAEKRDFDKDAEIYDLKPGRLKLAQDVASAIVRELKPGRDMDVLDFGCGTGLVTLQLQPLVRTITGVDSAPGMLDVLKRKVVERKLANVKTGLIDIEGGDRLRGRFNLIVSSMTLHHIYDLDRLFEEFYDCIFPGGHLSIADLDSDGGDFHREKAGVVHFGFERAQMRERFMRNGFQDVRDVTAASVMKDLPDGQSREFTVFLMYGRK